MRCTPFDWLTFLLAASPLPGAVYAMEELGGEGGRWQLPAAILRPHLSVETLAIPCRAPSSPQIADRLRIAQDEDLRALRLRRRASASGRRADVSSFR